MQGNLPTHVDPRLAIVPTDAAETLSPVPVAYRPPNIDQYASVCVHVREASFIASNDPIACNHPSPLPAIGPTHQAGGNYPPGNSGAGKYADGKVPANRKHRMSAGQLIGWICVAQLGVIIGMLGGQSWHIDQAARSIKDSLWAAAAPGLGFMFHGTNVASRGQGLNVSDREIEKTPAVAKKKNAKAKGTRGKKGGSSRSSWPIAKDFIPPPPPFIPGVKLMVPPPPAAVSLGDKAAGAVAASTLPDALILPLNESSTVTLVPTVNSAPAPGAATAVFTPTAASAPAALAAVPATAQAVPALVAPKVPVEVPIKKPAPHPSVPVAQATPAQSSARTVITKHRKRIITDR